jgi:hypothetical protein
MGSRPNDSERFVRRWGLERIALKINTSRNNEHVRGVLPSICSQVLVSDDDAAGQSANRRNLSREPKVYKFPVCPSKVGDPNGIVEIHEQRDARGVEKMLVYCGPKHCRLSINHDAIISTSCP